VINVVTKQEVLALYNAERGTKYTLVTLAQELLSIALKSQWEEHKRRQLVVEDIV